MLRPLFCIILLAAFFVPPGSIDSVQAQEIMSSPPGSSKLSEDYRKTLAKLRTLEESLGRCADLKDRGVRMTCYDNVVEGIGFMSAERVSENEKQLGKVGFWQMSKKESMDGTVQTYLRLESSNKVESRDGSERQPVLVVRCTTGKTDVFLDWKALVTPNPRETTQRATVTYYTNLSDQKTEDWEVSTDKFALFAPDSVTFIRLLMNQKKMTMKFVPEGSSVKTVFFDISGIETAINTIVKSCY